MHTVVDTKSKTVTLINESGTTVTATAAAHLGFYMRKDGGFSVWYDGKPAKDTIRTDKYGNLIGRNRKPIGAKKGKATRKRGPRYPVKVTMD